MTDIQSDQRWIDQLYINEVSFCKVQKQKVFDGCGFVVVPADPRRSPGAPRRGVRAAGSTQEAAGPPGSGAQKEAGEGAFSGLWHGFTRSWKTPPGKSAGSGFSDPRRSPGVPRKGVRAAGSTQEAAGPPGSGAQKEAGEGAFSGLWHGFTWSWKTPPGKSAASGFSDPRRSPGSPRRGVRAAGSTQEAAGPPGSGAQKEAGEGAFSGMWHGFTWF